MITYFNYFKSKFYFTHLILIFIGVKSNAQIIYTDLIPDSVIINDGDVYHLDLNNDGVNDFNLNFTKSTITSTHCTGAQTNHGVTVNPVDSLIDFVANKSYSGINFPQPIVSDSIINNTNYIWLGSLNQNLVNVHWICISQHGYHWITSTRGNWNGATDKFLGLKLNIGGNNYYGWVRLTIGGNSFIVKDYAFNPTPSQLIYAGQITTEFLTVSPITSSLFCPGNIFNIGYTVYGNFDSSNIFIAQLSDSSGSFTNPVAIGSISSRVSGTISATIPAGTVYGLLYRIRVVATSPISISNNNGVNLSVSSLLPGNHITTNDSTNLCPASSAILYAPLSPGNYYQWSLNNVNLFNANSYSLTCNSAGSYRCLISNGCGARLSDSIIINSLPAPTAVVSVLGSTWVCPGYTVTLNANTFPGYTYEWYWMGNIVSLQSAYTANHTGLYDMKVTDSAGCSTFSSHNMITIGNPNAEIFPSGPTSFCSGDSVIIFQTAITDSSFIFQWYLDNNIIPGAIFQSYTARNSGIYTLKITNPDGNCDSISNAISVNAVCSGLESIISTGSYFAINPNPANHFFEIKSQSEKPATVQIISLLGEIIYSEKINSSQKLIDISAFSEGIYFIKWIEESYSESKRFTIVK